jgi:hypothetical protein
MNTNINELTEKFTLDTIEIRQHAARPIQDGMLKTYAIGVMQFRMLEEPSVRLRFPVYAESDLHMYIASPEDLRYDVMLAVDVCNDLFMGVTKNTINDPESVREYIESCIRFEQFFEAELRAVENLPIENLSGIVVDHDPGLDYYNN